MKTVFLGIPGYGPMEPEAFVSIENALDGCDGIGMYSTSHSSSLLAQNFNTLFCMCMNARQKNPERPITHFAMLHSDVGCPAGWLGHLVNALDTHNLDTIHCSIPIKSNDGVTSTGLGYSTDVWHPVRRLTLKEAATLPPVFTLKDLQEKIDPKIQVLLPNTGCMVWKLGAWTERFPGFNIRDRVVVDSDGLYSTQVMPEDWNFGHWAHHLGVRVGISNAFPIIHVGRYSFDSRLNWGEETDTQWAQKLSSYSEALLRGETPFRAPE